MEGSSYTIIDVGQIILVSCAVRQCDLGQYQVDETGSYIDQLLNKLV